jgi:RNA polymerase sigma-70 factor (ECF subfamily)
LRFVRHFDDGPERENVTVREHEWLAERFETDRAHLRAVAYRMLGSRSEAEDAVQETWLRLSRSGIDGVENLTGWLTTVVARVCLDALRTRGSRREEPLDAQAYPSLAGGADARDPEHETQLADSVGIALLVVLETLTPPERVAFVLHDLFAVPFEEIAPIVGRTPVATRQLASRARRRVRGAQPRDTDATHRRAIVAAFLAASREGDFAALLALLDPDVAARADGAAVRMGAAAEILGAKAVAETFAGRARAARPALIDGAPGLVWARGESPVVAFLFTIERGVIVAIDLIADPERLARLVISYEES